MRLEILEQGVGQAVSMLENSNTPDERKSALEVVVPQLDRLSAAVQAIQKPTPTTRRKKK